MVILNFLYYEHLSANRELTVRLVYAAKVVTDRVSGYSKGFGFVRYATLEDSAKGIAGMDGKVNL